MKKYFLLVLFSCLFLQLSIAQSNLQAYLAYSVFSTPDNKPYIETYLTVLGNSVIYKKNDLGKFQGAVDVSLVFVQNNEIKNFKKYTLLSDELESELKPRTNFIDQQRFSLENGEYILELEIADKNASAASFKYQEKITIAVPSDKISISDIQLIESYKPTSTQNVLSKSGYDLVPYVSKYYPANFNNLTFYAEIYNANLAIPDSERYLLRYFIEDYDSKEKIEPFSNFAKYKTAKVSSLLQNFAIDKLHTGNYNLCIEAVNRENTLLASKKFFFQRNNPQAEDSLTELSQISLERTFVSNYKNRDSLALLIDALKPISTVAELNYSSNQLRAGEIDLMKRYFYTFWLRRNPSNPEQQWLQYKDELDEVNRLFSTSNRSKRGYGSDRGRVYLKYGKPSIRSINEQEPTSYPYEIWQYDRTKDGQNNRRFVFYNPYSGSNDYRLIHSDARGEIFDSRWRFKIDDRRINPNQKNNLDKETIDGNEYGRQVDDLYKNPR